MYSCLLISTVALALADSCLSGPICATAPCLLSPSNVLLVVRLVANAAVITAYELQVMDFVGREELVERGMAAITAPTGRVPQPTRQPPC